MEMGGAEYVDVPCDRCGRNVNASIEWISMKQDQGLPIHCIDCKEAVYYEQHK